VLPSNQVEKVVGWALSEHLQSQDKSKVDTAEGVAASTSELHISPLSIDVALKLLEDSKAPEQVRVISLLSP